MFLEGMQYIKQNKYIANVEILVNVFKMHCRLIIAQARESLARKTK